jgi:hypothetical protein
MGTGGPFPGGKALPGLDTTQPEVKNEKKLYFLFPLALSWRSGTALLLL